MTKKPFVFGIVTFAVCNFGLLFFNQTIHAQTGLHTHSAVMTQFNSRMRSYGQEYDQNIKHSGKSSLRALEDNYLSTKLGLTRNATNHMVVVDPLFLHIEEFPSKLGTEYQQHYFPSYVRQRTMNFYGFLSLDQMLFPNLPSLLNNEKQIREDFISGKRSDPVFIGIQLYTPVNVTDLGVTSQWDLFHNNNRSPVTAKLKENFRQNFLTGLRFLNQGDPVGPNFFLTVFSEFHYNGLSSNLYSESPYTPFWLATMDFRFGQSFATAINQFALSQMLEKLGFSDEPTSICVVRSDIPFFLADGYANWMSLSLVGKGINCRRSHAANILGPGTYATQTPKESTNTRKRKYFERTGNELYGCRQRDLVLIELEKMKTPYRYGEYTNSALLSALMLDFHTARYDEIQNVFGWAIVDFLIRGHFQNEPNLPRFQELVADLKEFYSRTINAFPRSTDKKMIQEVRALYQLLKVLEVFGEPASLMPDFKNTDLAKDLETIRNLRNRILNFTFNPEDTKSAMKDPITSGAIHRLSGLLAWIHKKWSVSTYQAEVTNEKFDLNYFRAFNAETPPAPPKRRSR
jgi:hypothetical protein